MSFGRVLTAMVTPSDDNLKVNYDQVAALAERLITSGSDGIVVSGTTGESATLTVEERTRLWKLVKEVDGNRGTVIAGSGNNCTEESIELTKMAEKTGVDGLLLVVPYYVNPPQEGLYQHFKAIASSTELPVILYNIPGRTVRNMDAQTTLRLAHDLPNIAAIKEAGKSIEQVIEICRNRPSGFQVFCGDDSATLAWLSAGADGVVSVASHLIGDKIQEMIKAFLSGDQAKAIEINGKLLPFFKTLFCTTNPIPVKAALNLQGFNVGGLRLPLIEANVAERETIRRCLETFELI
jgi:4-hydroxy-tetrahydrodipicolinate synthase